MDNNIEKVYVSKSCTGCGNCKNVCPSSAVRMDYDEYGFIYPCVDEKKCISCGICKKVCPSLSRTLSKCNEAYMVKCKDKDVYKNSASGGAFAGLAKYYLEIKGNTCVYGAAYVDGKVKHIRVTDISEIYRLQGSKYVQSELEDIFEDVRMQLENGKNVIFGGTPCQCQALMNFVKKYKIGFENLLIIDLICHGVSTMKFLKREVLEYSKEITDVNFRWKKLLKAKSFFLLRVKGRKIEKKIWLDRSPYYNAYMQGKILRESCYACNFCSTERVGDITIGDCGINDIYDFYKGQSVSSILINTEKGKSVWTECIGCFDFQEMNINEEIPFNPQLVHPFPKSADAQIALDHFNDNNISVKDLRVMYARPFKKSYYLRTFMQMVLPERILRKVIYK